MLTWSALISVRMVRDITEELDFRAGSSMSLICRDSVRCATLVLDIRASCQVKLTLLEPRHYLEDNHRTRHNWVRRSLFCSLQPQDEGTHMQMNMVDDFASMLL